MKAFAGCRRRWMGWVAVAGLLAVGAATVHAGTIYVSTAGNDANDGLGWGTAKKTVQAGLNAAVSGDQVWVRAGTYTQRITLKAGVALYGGFAGGESDLGQRNPAANVTVLDGSHAGSVVTAPAGVEAGTSINGFTIRNGSGTFSTPYRYGGGIYCKFSSPTITNNTITTNTTGSVNMDYGGGIYSESGSPTIRNNTISGNTVRRGGGGIYCVGGSPTIVGNTITSNTGGSSGGGIFCLDSTPTISNNTILGNTSNGTGGAIHCANSGGAILNNMIVANGAYTNGGGIYCDLSLATITNNTFLENIAAQGGGAYCNSGSPTITNCLAAFNSSGICNNTGTPGLGYNCVYGNTAYNYSGVGDPTGTNGNISADPKLASPAYGNLHIQADSPCGDAGDDGAAKAEWLDMDGQGRIFGGHVDIGADESDGTTWPAGPYIIVRVSPSGNDANDGSSWSLAKRTVQAGVDAAAAAGGEVWIAAAGQTPPIYQVGRITLRNFAHMYGGFDGTETQRSQRDWSAHETTLYGSWPSNSVIKAECIGPGWSTIDGFTIRDGDGTLLGTFSSGGAIYCNYASPMIANNKIMDSYADSGGGIASFWGSPHITGNTITNNHTNWGDGGGIRCIGGQPVITGNTITNNRLTAGGGGGIYCASEATISRNTISGNAADWDGGGICCESSPATISNNTITGNSSRDYGGGIYCANCSPTIDSNTISSNVGPFGGGGVYCVDSSPAIRNNSIGNNNGNRGGAIYCSRGAPAITNNTLTGNNGTGGGVYCSEATATIANNVITGNNGSSGGGIYCADGFVAISNNTVSGNAASVGGGICTNSPGTIANTIVAFNSSGIFAQESSSPDMLHNCVYGNAEYDYFSGLPNPTGTNGNISADPLFASVSPGPDETWGTADDTFGDLRLLPFSPCIDAGNNADVPADAADLDGDGDVTEPLPFDLAGQARFLDDPQVADTGAGIPPIVDIGAYERCRPVGDVDGDWLTDVVDLLYMVDAFGTSTSDPAYDPRCDFNSDGAVDVVDLLDVVYNFGK